MQAFLKSVEQWLDDIVSVLYTWEETLKENWNNALDDMKQQSESTFTSMKNQAVEQIDAIISKINELCSAISNALSAIESLASAYESLGSLSISGVSGVSFNVGTYATGGFPQEYSLFMAGENGQAEILGTVGGKTAVAGSAEITGIAEAVYSTGGAQTSLLQSVVSLLQAISEKDTSIELDGRELVSAIDSRRTRNGYQLRVT